MRLFWGCIILFIGLVIQVQAGEIKAIVNDTPISAFDVESRAKMIMLQQAGLVGKLTDELRQEALDELVDERIKFQAVHQKGIQITDNDIQEALAHLEAQNGLPAGGFKEMLSGQGIPYQTLIEQTRANLGWLRYMQQSGRTLDIKEADVKLRRDAIRKELGQETVSFAEIVVPTESEAMVIWQQLQNGSDFATQVELHSIADSRLTGGRVMNVSPDYYGDEMARIFAEMQAGQLSRPIQVKNGYAVILMLNKREAITGDTITVWELMQAVVPEGSVAETLLSQPINEGCQGFAEVVKDDALPGSFQQGQTSPAQLPEDIAPMLKAADFGKVAGPLRTPAGLLYFMKCGSSEQRVMPTDEELKMQIEGEKMELLSRQLLSELKRDAVVEYKE